MRMTQILKTKEGKWSLWKAVPVGAIISGLILFAATTSYHRYSWIRDQAYKVAVNEKYIIEAKQNLEAKDTKLENMLKELKAELKKSDGILHGRLSGEVNKREHADERIMDLVIKILEHSQKQVEIQQKGLEKEEEYYMEQRSNGNGNN